MGRFSRRLYFLDRNAYDGFSYAWLDGGGWEWDFLGLL
jgi:hypothetical protein